MSTTEHLTLTEIQSKSLKELRQKLSNETYGDYKYGEDILFLYRFLKARDFNIDKAEVLIKKYFQWKSKNDAIYSVYKPPEVLDKYLANVHIGYDKEGCPVFYLPPGKYDIKGLFMSAKYSDFEKTFCQILMSLENTLEATGRITKFVIIFDEAGLTFANATNKKVLEYIIRFLKLQQDILPERLKVVLFINVPSYFVLGFNICKSFMTEKTLKKMHILGTDGWQEKVIELIDAEQLPAFLGGTKKDPDGNPLCKTFLDQGGPIDEKYYIHRSRRPPLSTHPGVQRLHVSRWSSAQITVNVLEAGSVIEWEFETTAGDVIFEINRTGTDGQTEEVLPKQKINTQEFSEVGMHKCDAPGTYFIIFDNSYSWLCSKEIHYRIKVSRSRELVESPSACN